MITFIIDEIVPCLKDTKNGDIYETEVIRVRRKSVLSRYNVNTGWYTNWSNFSKDTEVYALVLKGTYDIQGLVAIEKDDVLQAVHILWACVSPENNYYKYGKKKFSGVGAHLFAIAADLSEKYGYDGFVYGEATSLRLLNYYCNFFNAEPLPAISTVASPYRFMLSDTSTQKLREVYMYDWSEEAI